ncbi:Gustatory receptor 5a for trehalose [Lucilia cuprina]|uniref:Gustatory receptor n=1 Tax=Lucilia cuprina TaxID=7375 RepID=A0A0L0BPS4_LUCCU|nr:Gustatory receptor 5a for trehalose [Lucilia cuprina]
MAQCFCLMPVRGILSKSAKGLSFSWYSFRTFYCLLYMLTTILDTMLTTYKIVHSKLDVRNIEPFIFHFSILLASIGFLRLASKWPQLMRRWQEVEEQLPPFNNWVEKEELATRIKTVTFVLITLSLTEHLLSTISAIHFANYCPSASDPIKSFFLNVVDQIFYIFDYSPWLAWMGKIQNILLTFGWTYMDVFVMNVGIGLSSMFKRVQTHMENVQGLEMRESFWAKCRYQYTLICNLIDEVDAAVSGIIMLKMPSIAHAIYFYFSLMFLLARTLAVSLYLAEVNDRSRDPLTVIKQIPPNCYYPEVERFVLEININKVAMTGMQYFDVTRKLVLTVAGTIVTYELVLIQFHEDQKPWHCGTD